MLKIEDSICDYLSNCPETWSVVQIKHLLTQSSGIPSEFTQAEFQEESGTFALLDATIERIQDDELDFEPGTSWEHDNDRQSFILLGLIIENVSGQPYETFLQENIFTPLDMQDTGIALDNTDLALGYFSPAATNPAPEPDRVPQFSALGLTSTMDDMLIWGQGLLTSKVASEETMEAIFSRYTPIDDDNDTGLGWIMGEIDGHNSARMLCDCFSGFVSDMVVFPEDDLVLLILANQGVDTSYIGDKLISMVFEEQ